MTSIDPRQRLTALVRSEVAAFQERAGTQRARKTPGTESPQRAGGTDAALLAQRLGAISPEDPQRRQKAFRVFLESTLLRELGGGLIQDPRFPQMVDAVQARIQEDAQLDGAAEEVAVYLLRESRCGNTPKK